MLKAMPLPPSGRQGQHRIKTVQSLNRGFLIHTKYGCVLWRGQIQSNHVGSFVFKVWIVAGHVTFQPMRTHIGLRENPLNGVFAP
jgi:hypothetical protein